MGISREQIKGALFPHDNKKEHFKALDGLRGIAVLLVLLSHTSNAEMFFHETLNFQRVGKVGVYLFFVLSAYLLDRQISIALIANKSSKQFWLNYILRRFLRIYPLFVISLLIHSALTFLGYYTVIDQSRDLPMHMLLLQGESIFWSIPVEFKYYLISPLILFFCHKFLKWNLKSFIILCLGLILSTIVIDQFISLPWLSTFKYFPIFLIGTLISVYELLRKETFTGKNKSLLIDVLALCGFSLIVLSIPYYFMQIFGTDVNFHEPIYFLPYGVIWGLILVAAKYGRGLFRKIFEWKILRFFGVISFSMYLFHMPVLVLMKNNFFHVPQGGKIYVFFALTTVISLLSYLLIEKPLSNIRLYKQDLSEQLITSNEKRS